MVLLETALIADDGEIGIYSATGHNTSQGVVIPHTINVTSAPLALTVLSVYTLRPRVGEDLLQIKR
jgi:hypothetical protein